MHDPHESAPEPHASPVVHDPHSLLLYIIDPMALVRLKAVLDLHQVPSSDPMPNAALLTASSDLLAAAVSQWQESLEPAQADKVGGALLDADAPSPAEVTEAMLHLISLDTVLERLQARWLPRLLRRDAEHRDAIFSMYQPLVSVAKHHVVAYECLMRARDAGLSIGAGKLAEAARVMGMTHQLDKAAWRSGIRTGANLAQQGFQLFVNFTPSSISDLKFGLQEAVATCREHGVPFENLVFEVTEGEQVRDIRQLEKIISSYRAEGAKVALDDLGSGYSSILHLADLLPDYVKLDQGLVHGAQDDYVRSVLLKGITDAAHELGILVVAEGVETEEDLKFCIAIDADLVQGYYLAKPAETPEAVSTQALQTLSEWVRDLKPAN